MARQTPTLDIRVSAQVREPKKKLDQRRGRSEFTLKCHDISDVLLGHRQYAVLLHGP